MVSIEDVETLMLHHFPQCPLCGAIKGYEVSGWAKNYVQCKSCGAKWTSNDFIGCRELKDLELWEPSSDGKGVSLLKKIFSVKFWQDAEAIENAETKSLETKAELIFSPNMTNEQLERRIMKSLEEITNWDYGSTIYGKGLGSLISNTSPAEATTIRLLKAILEQNKITIIQNELIRREFLKSKAEKE